MTLDCSLHFNVGCFSGFEKTADHAKPLVVLVLYLPWFCLSCKTWSVEMPKTLLLSVQKKAAQRKERERERTTTRGNARRARWTNLPSRVETPLNPEASNQTRERGREKWGEKQSERKHTVKSRMVKFSNRWSSPRLHSLSHGISATSDCGIVESESNANHPSLNPKRPKNKRKRKETQAPTVDSQWTWFWRWWWWCSKWVGGQAGIHPYQCRRVPSKWKMLGE